MPTPSTTRSKTITAIRPKTTLSLVAASVLVLAGCSSASAGAEGTSAAESQTVTYTWDRNVAAEDKDPEFIATTVEVPKNPENIVVFDMASLDTIGALGGKIAGAPLDSVPDYLQGHLADDAFKTWARCSRPTSLRSSRSNPISL